MAPGKDNLLESVSVLTQRQLNKFVRDYNIPLDLNSVLPSKDETIYPFRQGKFPLYTRVCNFANYRVPFSRFLIRVLQFFRVHISQVNPFGLSSVNHFEISCRALDQRPDLNVFRYFYEFITAGDWYTFAHRKGIPPPSSDESQADRDWPVIRRKRDRKFRPFTSPSAFFLSCLTDLFYLFLKRRYHNVSPGSLKVPSFDVFDFDFEEQGEDEVPLMKQVALAAQEIRPLVAQDAAEPSAADGASSVPTPTKEAAGSSGSQAGKRSILDDVDDDPEIRKLDEALQSRPSSASLTSKGVAPDPAPKPLVRKRKNETVQIRSSDPLPMPRSKENKRGSSFSEGNVMNELDEHLTGGKFSREEAALARTKPTPTFSGGFLPSNEVESMETEIPETTSKEKEKLIMNLRW
ncbi:hypothetical protein HanPI659440_Chr04g0149751 [Helianthus annuus]|nr:hypothetical protein HanPI659440_Chr04g0149751 [Helianthus annuus]